MLTMRTDEARAGNVGGGAVSRRLWRARAEIEIVFVGDGERPGAEAREYLGAELRANDIEPAEIWPVASVDEIPAAWTRAGSTGSTPLVWGPEGDYTAEEWLAENPPEVSDVDLEAAGQRNIFGSETS